MSAELKRRSSRQVAVGDVLIGGGAPIVVQSMTNTDTADAAATALQVEALARAGSELVRITVNTPEAAQQVPYIREQLDRMGISVPLIGDFHYNGHRLLIEVPACAQALPTILGAPNVLRGKSQSGSMRAIDAILAGVGNILCSDYQPSTLIAAAYTAAWQAGLPLNEALALVTANPAEACLLRDRGRLAPGLRADRRHSHSRRRDVDNDRHRLLVDDGWPDLRNADRRHDPGADSIVRWRRNALLVGRRQPWHRPP